MLSNMTPEELASELQRGARFVVYQYCVSLILVTFRQSTPVIFVRAASDHSFTRGLGCTLVSLLFGWWGIPWGPIYTIGAIVTNLSGGRNVTREVMANLPPSNLSDDHDVTREVMANPSHSEDAVAYCPACNTQYARDGVCADCGGDLIPYDQ